MNIDVNKCPRCAGTGHDKGGQPVVKMEKYNDAEHGEAYVSDGVEQRKFHRTIKLGSGCMMCFGRGFIDAEAK